MGLGCIFIDTFAMASLFEGDSYKPNEIIEVNRKLLRVAGSRKIDTVYTDHFPKKIKRIRQARSTNAMTWTRCCGSN